MNSSIQVSNKLFGKSPNRSLTWEIIYMRLPTSILLPCLWVLVTRSELLHWEFLIFSTISQLFQLFTSFCKGKFFIEKSRRQFGGKWVGISVTRSGDLLDFWQLFKAFGNNQFAQIFHILREFL